MLDWPSVGPEDLRCPTLWLMGSEDAPAVANLEQYRALLKGSKVQERILADFNHMQVFDEIDIVCPLMLSFSGL